VPTVEIVIDAGSFPVPLRCDRSKHREGGIRGLDRMRRLS
jgi:hypothetical protein